MIPTQVSQACVNLVKRFEGLAKVTAEGDVRAYRCPAGRWTIGYGHTKGVRSGHRISIEDAEELLIGDIEVASSYVRQVVEVPLTQPQFDALASFVFNVGTTNFKRSTLLKRLNAGKYTDVPSEMLKWDKATIEGVLTVLRGLTRRRTAEAALFTMDAPLADDGGDMMPQKVACKSVKPLSKSKTLAGAGIVGASTLLQEIASKLQGLTAYSDYIQYLFLGVSLMGISLVVYSRVKDHKEGTH
jgi:lysozyme